MALLRGVNVGRAKRLAMADLRKIVEDLGYTDVRTLLNSGNVVFTGRSTSPAAVARRVEQALAEQLGLVCRVIVLGAEELEAIVEHNPLADVASDPARLLVAVLARPADRARLLNLAQQEWGSERIAIGARVAYAWCADGILTSGLLKALASLLGDAVTTRNWTTIVKLRALARE